MVFNALIMAISLNQPNSSHSINETRGLLHSINTQRHTTFGGHRADTSQYTLRYSNSTSPPPDQVLSSDSWVPSAKQALPTATAAPQPPGHGNIFFCSIIIWTLLCILHGSSNTICTDLTVGVPLAGTPPVSRTSRSSSDSLSRRSNRLSVASTYHEKFNCRNHALQRASTSLMRKKRKRLLLRGARRRRRRS